MTANYKETINRNAMFDSIKSAFASDEKFDGVTVREAFEHDFCDAFNRGPLTLDEESIREFVTEFVRTISQKNPGFEAIEDDPDIIDWIVDNVARPAADRIINGLGFETFEEFEEPDNEEPKEKKPNFVFRSASFIGGVIKKLFQAICKFFAAVGNFFKRFGNKIADAWSKFWNYLATHYFVRELTRFLAGIVIGRIVVIGAIRIGVMLNVSCVFSNPYYWVLIVAAVVVAGLVGSLVDKICCHFMTKYSDYEFSSNAFVMYRTIKA